jgi:hypothetical protein
MTIPGPGQSIHLMTRRDVLRVKWDIHRKERRIVREFQLYTLDDLRERYQTTKDATRLSVEVTVSRVQLYAEIRWRIWREWLSYGLLLFLSAVAAVASVIAAAEGWKNWK